MHITSNITYVFDKSKVLMIIPILYKRIGINFIIIKYFLVGGDY